MTTGYGRNPGPIENGGMQCWVGFGTKYVGTPLYCVGFVWFDSWRWFLGMDAESGVGFAADALYRQVRSAVPFSPPESQGKEDSIVFSDPTFRAGTSATRRKKDR